MQQGHVCDSGGDLCRTMLFGTTVTVLTICVALLTTPGKGLVALLLGGLALAWSLLVVYLDRNWQRRIAANGLQMRETAADCMAQLRMRARQCAGGLEHQLSAMKQEVTQTLALVEEAIGALLASFSGITEHACVQQALAQSITSGQVFCGSGGDGSPCPRVGGVTDDCRHVDQESMRTTTRLASLTATVEREVNAAVSGMQFQDIVTQLLGHIGKRIDALAGVLSLAGLEQRPASGACAGGIEPVQQLRALVQVMDEVTAAMRQARVATSRSPVKRVSMCGGEIELF